MTTPNSSKDQVQTSRKSPAVSKPAGRRSRTGHTPVDPAKFVPIERPSNATLRGTVIAALILATLAGAIICASAVMLFNPDNDATYLIAAAVGATLGATLEIRVSLHNGRRRREDFVRCGGDPTGITDMMFGAMRGWRTADGKWEVPEQGSGDYV